MRNLTLYDFQQKGVQKVLEGLRRSPFGFFLCDEQGLGKTIQALAVAETMRERGEIQRILIVAPAMALREWERMIKEFTDESYLTLYDSSGTIGRTTFTIMSFDRFRKIEAELDKSVYQLLILDEFHMMKNSQTKRAKSIKNYRFPYVLMLTGTPILNRNWELWSALNYITPVEFPSFKKFLHEYSKVYTFYIKYRRGSFVGRKRIDKPYGTKNLDQLRTILKKYMIRRKKETVLQELPEKIYQQVVVSLKPTQKKYYTDMKDKLKAAIGKKKITALNALSLFTRLRQVCDGTSTVADKDESSKLDALETLVGDLLAADGNKVIVFTSFRAIANSAAKRLKKYHPVLSIGSTPPKQVTEQIARFQSDTKCRLYIGTIAKNYQAITLSAANYVIFVGSDLRPKINEQAEDRAHRIGQKNSVVIIKIIAKDTIDEKIQELLDEKSDEFSQVIEGKSMGAIPWVNRLLK